jgi:hypothetical protein
VRRSPISPVVRNSESLVGQAALAIYQGSVRARLSVEEVLVRYFNERLVTSPRQRMAVAGREVLRWLAQPHVMKMQRGPFEALLLEIAEFSEEWLTSAQSLGLAKRMEANRVLGYEGLSRTTDMTTRSSSRVGGIRTPRRVPSA